MDDLLTKVKKFPSSPGVYLFKNNRGEVIYVGKAASLKDRVRSYFSGKNYYARPIDFVIDQIIEIDIKKTDTVLEAYFLEQNLIKRHQPKYNVLGKDDKSFVYVCLTKEEFPRFEIKRRTDLIGNYEHNIAREEKIEGKDLQFIQKINKKTYSKIYGPYTSRYLIEQALRILRKIFPYHNKPQHTEKGCLDYHMGLCPGPYAGNISKQDYKKNIQSIEFILQGKKKSLIRNIEKGMEESSKKLEFEKAAKARNLLFALRHIQDVAMLSREEKYLSPTDREKIFRIEGYDISNISGKYAVGSMVVFDNEEGEMRANKKEYRRFKIKTLDEANDVGAMEEILRRRFKNSWKMPDLLLLDGGKGHLNAAKKVLRDCHFDIPVVAVAKGPKRNKLDLYYHGNVEKISQQVIVQTRDEAHRFAVSYHRKLRDKLEQ